MKKFFETILGWLNEIPKDKLLHDFVIMVVFVFSFALFFRFCPLWLCFTLSNAICVTLIVLKEVYDSKNLETHSVEVGDILWGLFGALKGNLVFLLMLL